MNTRDRWKLWKLYPQMVFVAFDQLLNALIPPFVTLSWPDETMSARIYRTAAAGELFPRVLMPAVDLMFAWQDEDEEINRTAGRSIRNHCERAYWKEKLRRQSPPEERN